MLAISLVLKGSCWAFRVQFSEYNFQISINRNRKEQFIAVKNTWKIVERQEKMLNSVGLCQVLIKNATNAAPISFAEVSTFCFVCCNYIN